MPDINRRKIALGILFLCGLAAVAFWFARSRSEPIFRLEVTPEITIELVALLTEGNSTYGEHSLVYKAFSALPDNVQEIVRNNLGEPSSAGRIEPNLPARGIGLLFHVTHPPEYKQSDVSSIPTDKLRGEFQKADFNLLHLKFAEGVYSMSMSFADNHPHWPGRRDSESFFCVWIPEVLPTVPELSLEFLHQDGPDGLSPKRLVHSVQLKNPLYSSVDPLSPVEPLPATKSQDGVEVTMRKLVTHAANPNHYQSDRWEKVIKAAQSDETILRGEGTLDDPFSTILLLDVVEPGKNPDWKLNDAWLIYGDNEHSFNYNKTDPISLSNFPEPDRYMMAFRPDLNVVGKPIKVQVELLLRSKLAADEIKTVDLSLQGDDLASTKDVSGFWAGPVTATAYKVDSSEAHDPESSPTLESSQDLMKVFLSAPLGITADLTSATLISEDRSVTLQVNQLHSGGRPTSLSNSLFRWHLRYEDSTTDTNTEPLNLEQYTTLSLTIQAPRKQTYEFIVEPEEARQPVSE